MKTITVDDGTQLHTLALESADDIWHAQYVLSCLGLAHANVDDDDAADDAPRYVLRAAGPPVLVTEQDYYRRANVVVRLLVDGRERVLSGLTLSQCGVDASDDAKFADAFGRHVARELRCMLQDAALPDELPF